MQQLKWVWHQDPNIGLAKTGPTGPLAMAMISDATMQYLAHDDPTRILPRLSQGSDKSLVMLPCKIWPW